MKYVLPTAMAVALLALAGCERPASTSSTTVVQPTKEKETVVQRDAPASPPASTSSTTVVNPAPATPPATSSSTNVTIDATKPQASTTERSTTERSTTTERVDTPMGSATRTETSKTTR